MNKRLSNQEIESAVGEVAYGPRIQRDITAGNAMRLQMEERYHFLALHNVCNELPLLDARREASGILCASIQEHHRKLGCGNQICDQTIGIQRSHIFVVVVVAKASEAGAVEDLLVLFAAWTCQHAGSAVHLLPQKLCGQTQCLNARTCLYAQHLSVEVMDADDFRACTIFVATYTILLKCRRLFAQHQLTGSPREPGIAQWLLGHIRNRRTGADNIQHGFAHSLEQIGLRAAIAIDFSGKVDLLRTLIQIEVYLQVIRVAWLGPLDTGKGHELVRCAKRATRVGFATSKLKHSR